MHQLPNEVLNLILENLKHDAASPNPFSFTTVLLVCHRWRDAGLKILYTDVVIDTFATLQAFPSQLTVNTAHHIESLTLIFRRKNLRRTNPDSLFPEEHGQNPAFASESTRVGWNALSSLVASLPPSIKNLELDTKCYEDTRAKDIGYNICDLLQHRVLTLEHLRLRLARLSCSFLCPSTSLKTVVIYLLSDEYSSMTRQYSDVDYSTSEVDSAGIDSRDAAGRRTREALVQYAASHVRNLPNVTEMRVIDSQMYLPGLYDIINIRDIRTARTTVSIRTKAYHTHSTYPILHLRYVCDDGTIKDILGHYANVEELLEGPAWSTTILGSRFPAVFRDSAEGQGHQWVAYNKYRTTEGTS